MSFQHDSQSEYAWVTKFDPLPDVCCSCGMFTDNRVTVKHVDFVERPAGESESGLSILLNLGGLFLLGPLGWMIAAFLRGEKDENGTKTVKEKTKIKISQCVLCFGSGPPEAVDSQQQPASLMFLVHPRFMREFDTLKIKMRDEARDGSA
jgi:hypothetical protein